MKQEIRKARHGGSRAKKIKKPDGRIYTTKCKIDS